MKILTGMTILLGVFARFSLSLLSGLPQQAKGTGKNPEQQGLPKS